MPTTYTSQKKRDQLPKIRGEKAISFTGIEAWRCCAARWLSASLVAKLDSGPELTLSASCPRQAGWHFALQGLVMAKPALGRDLETFCLQQPPAARMNSLSMGRWPVGAGKGETKAKASTHFEHADHGVGAYCPGVQHLPIKATPGSLPMLLGTGLYLWPHTVKSRRGLLPIILDSTGQMQLV